MPHHCKKYDHKKFSVKHLFGKYIKSKKIKSCEVNTKELEADKAQIKNIETEKIVVDGIRVNTFQSQTLVSKRHDISSDINFSVNTQSDVCPILNIQADESQGINYPATILEGTNIKGVREAVFDILVKPLVPAKVDNTTTYFTYVYYQQSNTIVYLYNIKTNQFDEVDTAGPAIVSEDYFFSIGVTRLLENTWQDLHLGAFLSQVETEKIVEVQRVTTPQIYIALYAQSDVGTQIEFCEGSKVQLIY